MSPADSADGGPLRQHYTAELEQLALQVEMMGVLVDQNLERMREVLHTGSERVALEAITTDDRIDAMNVSLMERCYELLAPRGARWPPTCASSSRCCGSPPSSSASATSPSGSSRPTPTTTCSRSVPRAFDVLQTMADHAIDRYRDALRAWSALDLDVANRVGGRDARPAWPPASWSRPCSPTTVPTAWPSPSVRWWRARPSIASPTTPPSSGRGSAT